MINVNNFIIIPGLLINLILIAGFIFGKKIIRSQTTTDFNSKYGVALAIIFTLYLISLIILTVIAFIHSLYSFGIILSLFLIIPFIIGYISTFEKAEFFVNIQVFALCISFFTITSMIGAVQVQNIKLSDKDKHIQKPVMNNHLLTH